jgi:hypothetical protein
MKNRELYTHVFEHDGNACVCITKVTIGKQFQTKLVRVYDLDAGSIFVLQPRNILDAPKLRESEPEDFEFSVILDSLYADEACEIKCELFD